MKITCQSCQSKYTVSDEKVQGKTVKIKCRKCGATILVNSGGVTQTPGNADPVSLTGAGDGGSAYLVNVAEGDQRSMSLAEIVIAYNSSVVTPETYVWADGMGDWQPLGQVEAIVTALTPSAPASAPPPEPVPDHRAAARRDPGRGGRDLFGGGQAMEEVATSAPMTNGAPMAARPFGGMSAGGGKEENSMVFSLSALTAKAVTTPSSPSRAQAARDREDSGVIDLKALAASAAVPAAAPAQPNYVPDAGLFPLGMPQMAAAPMPVQMAAPALPPQKSKAPLFIALGGLVAVAAIVGAFFVMKGSGDKPVAAAAPTDSAPSAAPSASEAASAAAAASASASADAAASASAAAAASASAAASAKVAKAPVVRGPLVPRNPSGPAAVPAAPAAAAAAPKRGGCGCAAGDLMCAMRCSAK